MSSNSIFIHMAGATAAAHSKLTAAGNAVQGPIVVLKKKTKGPAGSFCVRRAGAAAPAPPPVGGLGRTSSASSDRTSKIFTKSKTAPTHLNLSNGATTGKKVTFSIQSSKPVISNPQENNAKPPTNVSSSKITPESSKKKEGKPCMKQILSPHKKQNIQVPFKSVNENAAATNSQSSEASSANDNFDGHCDDNSHSHANRTSQASSKQSSFVSSLFAGNPKIPTLPKVDVSPIQEEVFSSDSFESLDINPVLVSHVNKLGYSSLTVVQQRGIPAILKGSDVLIKSQTGSGKTLTYALPIVNALFTRTPRVDRSAGVLALVVVPTRELALQTYRWLEDLCRACVSIVPGYLIGGEKKKSEKHRLRRGVNILVATPGRLQDHISTTECLKLSQVQFFVLDEADRMLEMGYEKAISGILEALVEAKLHGDEKRFLSKHEAVITKDASKRRMADEEEEDSEQESNPSKKLKSNNSETIAMMTNNSMKPNEGKAALQTIMLSATLTEEVQRLAGLSLHSPEVVDVSGDGNLDDLSAVTPGLLVHHYTLVPAKLRLVTLFAFILSKCMYGAHRKMLVFMATQDMVDYHTALLQTVLARYGRIEKKTPVKSEEEMQADQVLDFFDAKKKKKKPLAGEAKKTDVEVDDEPLIHFMQLRGNMSQAERTNVFNQFRTASSGVLLSTDVAARGLDLPSVSWIVQFTGPTSVRDYVHRVGRTSRANTRGDALLVLAPSEAGFIEQLEKSKIALSEIKVEKILRAFILRPPKVDPEFVLPRSLQEGATKLQLQCEHLLLSDATALSMATKAYMSFIRAYASYPRDMRQIFCYKALHLGHYAKSFGLRDAPSCLHAHQTYRAQAAHKLHQEKQVVRQKAQFKKVLAQKSGAQPKMATISEFDSGLDDITPSRSMGAPKKKPSVISLKSEKTKKLKKVSKSKAKVKSSG